MTLRNLLRPGRQRSPLVIVGLLWLLALVLPLHSALAAGSQPASQTLFLPLKVYAANDQAEFSQKVDQQLAKILAARQVPLIDRARAAAVLDYRQGAWPPGMEQLQPLLAGRPVNYLVVGSLTRLGDRFSLDFTALDVLGQSPPKYFYQQVDSLEQLNQALSQLVGKVLAYTEREFLIADIEITGNHKTDSGAILQQISSQPGDRFDAAKLRHDLKQVFKMGYFDDVQVEVTDTPAGKKVIFKVKEKAVIGQVSIAGNKKLEKDEIMDVVTVSPNTIISTKDVQESVDNIRKLYKEKGFYNTRVTAKLSYGKKDRVNIRFLIKEGVKVYIKEIRLVGNTAFSDKEIRKVMATSEKGWFSWLTESGRLKRDLLEQDRARIAAFYHNHGFIEAKVSEPEIHRKGDSLTVTFNISEGERYRVGTIKLRGDLIEDKNDLFGLIKLSREKYFNRKVLREDVMRLTDRYAEKGYAYAEVTPHLKKNPKFRRMDVEIDIRKGVLVHIRRIIIKGNTRTRDKVIRREIRLKEGGIFNASALRKSTERLQRLEYFEEVNITPEPTDREDQMDILVEVKEKPTGTFSIGAGYSSVDNLMFMGEISQNNFLGKGQRLSAQANFSSSTTRYNLSFTEPHLNDSKLLFGLDLYNWRRDYDDYSKDSTGGSLRFGYPVWERWKAFWGYGYDDTSLSDIKPTASQIIKDSANINTTSYLRLGLVRDTRNRLYGTSKGSVQNIAIKHAGGLLGGDSSFTKLEGSTSWFFPLPWETVFHIKGAAGYAIENKKDKLPVYEKFYLGGLRTVRGFDNGKISPKDPVTGERIGGEKMWYMNTEWIFPLVKDLGLRGVVFFDAGNSYRDSETWDIGDLKKSVGLGFRWLSPMGPLRLEWGYNLDPAPDEQQGVWDFSLGGAF